MPADAIGLDIGGANLKAADAIGRSLIRPFELWRHPERLVDELARIRDIWPDSSAVAVTMTGELCDCFETKRDGVRHILAAVKHAFGNLPIGVWSLDGVFLSVAEAITRPIDVAAANWHAQATFAGRYAREGAAILVDTGSTTTDVIPLMNGKPVAVGRTDSDRLKSRELVYTGARRTPICAVLGEKVAAELFATTLDAYIALELIPEDADNRSTADGRPATKHFALARLARMIGGDAETISPMEITAIAHDVLAAQSQLIATAIIHVCVRLQSPLQCIIVSGSGGWLAEHAIASMPVGVGDIRRVYIACPESACAHALAVLYGEVGRCA